MFGNSCPATRGVSPDSQQIAAAGGMLLWREYKEHQDAQAREIYGKPRSVESRGELSDLEKTNIAIYKNAKASVVHITSIGLERDEWSLNVQEVPEDTGSVFSWDDGGHAVVVKNNFG
ncbi:MAG: hypothetical protein ACYC3I_20405 [Gemmataceae bacterium]